MIATQVTSGTLRGFGAARGETKDAEPARRPDPMFRSPLNVAVAIGAGIAAAVGVGVLMARTGSPAPGGHASFDAIHEAVSTLGKVAGVWAAGAGVGAGTLYGLNKLHPA